MANFLITSPSSETVGTNTADLFSIQALQGVSVFGVEGSDTLSANIAAGASAARINAGKGADTINLTGGSLDNSQIFGGAGHDQLNVSKSLTSTVLRGGQGFDTITFNGALNTATIAGNDLADVISAGINAGSQAGFIGAGKGGDRLSAVFAGSGGAFVINGGAGHDSLSILGAGGTQLSAFTVAGGDGLDTINFNANAASDLTGAFNINGDALGDRLVFAGAVNAVGTATIGGGAGADTILFSAAATLTNGFINAGAGLDSIRISGAFNGGTLNGGAGVDSITLGTYAISGSNGGIIFGDAGADVISLGAASFAAATGAGGATITGAAGSVLGYSDFTQSNLSNTDFVSAGLTITTGSRDVGSGIVAANLFSIRQSAVTAVVGSNLTNQLYTTNTGGAVTFTATFDNSVTARVTELDRNLVAGSVVSFADGGNRNYVFIQGGAAGSGVDGDLLIRTNTAVNALAVSANFSIDARTLQNLA